MELGRNTGRSVRTTLADSDAAIMVEEMDGKSEYVGYQEAGLPATRQTCKTLRVGLYSNGPRDNWQNLWRHCYYWPPEIVQPCMKKSTPPCLGAPLCLYDRNYNNIGLLNVHYGNTMASCYGRKTTPLQTSLLTAYKQRQS